MSPMPAQQSHRNAEGDLDPNVIAHELEEFGIAYARAKHAADLLEDTNSAVKANLTNEKRKENPEATRKECEDMALGSPEWMTHVYATADAVRDKNIALARWKAVQAKFEAMRTAEATKRAQMNMR